MSADADVSGDAEARRIASGPPPSRLVHPLPGAVRSSPEPPPAPYDPLRLCIFATIALLGWLTGPLALLVFSAVGFVGYAKARRAGLRRSKCFLRDTRLVLAYLGILVLAGAWGAAELIARLSAP